MVPRTELVERLVSADPQSVTTIVGAAGMGKSSVLAQWYEHSNDGSTAWLSADRGDADPIRFWRGFIAAIQTVEPQFGIEAADVITLDGAVTPDVLESLLADDHTELPRRVRLVIDDFHLVSAEAAQHLQHVLERGLFMSDC
jgi:ATP/maltotriose-dependent transcriptional regulator MalT